MSDAVQARKEQKKEQKKDQKKDQAKESDKSSKACPEDGVWLLLAASTLFRTSEPLLKEAPKPAKEASKPKER